MPSLVQAFGKTGRKYASALREQLPKIAFGSSYEKSKAQIILQQAADRASLEMKAASAVFIKGETLAKAAAVGGRKVAAQVGIKFGGVNQTLINQLNLSVAKDLAKASNGPLAYYNVVIRELTVTSKEALGKTRSLLGADEKASQSLIQSALSQNVYEKASQRLLADLGLKESDNVLFMSGRRMNAEAYAKLVVRTRTIEALNKGKASTLTENGYEYIETSQHDGVDEKDICYFLQGKVWALVENDLDIPMLPEEYGLPPWHPNCGHTFGAWQPKFESNKAISKAVDEHDNDEEDLAAWGGKTYQPSSDES